MAAQHNELFERYPSRQVFRLYLTAEAASALGVVPNPTTGRLYVDTNDPRVAAITIKAGWFVVQGSTNARQQYYLNDYHVVAVVFDSDEDLPSGTA